MKTFDSLDSTFGIEDAKYDLITSDGEVVVTHSKEIEDNADKDYEATRSNLYGIIDSGQQALSHALEIAKGSEDPKAFEVVGKLMKQLADANDQLLKLSEKRVVIDRLQKEPTSSKPPAQSLPAPGKVVNNAIFVGSTAELSRMIKNINEE